MADWREDRDADGRTWIGRTRRQSRADIVLALGGCTVLTVAFIVVRGRGWADVVPFAVIGAIAGYLFWRRTRSWRSRLFGLWVSDFVLEIRQGVRTTRVPWTEVTGVRVEHQPSRGGDVVVIEMPDRIVLPAPLRARRFWPSWLGDPDFDAKVGYLRAHCPTGDPGPMSPR